MQPERRAARDRLVIAAGLDGATILPLAADASFRRYDRIIHPDGRRAVLMDAPPPNEDVRPFVRIARLLGEWNLSAPRVMATDAEHGFLVLEDLGDDRFTLMLAAGFDETQLYLAAVDVLAGLAGRVAPPDLPAQDLANLLDEVCLFLDWRWPEIAGRPANDAERRSFRDAWAEVLVCPSATQDVLVLRDYHLDNLMWLPDREGVRRVGLLDFQDAVRGNPAYDIASLVSDVRRDVPPAVAEAAIAHFLGLTGLAPGPFRASLAILGAQRNTRILGVFTRLWRRDGKSGYLKWLPRTWALVRRDLAHPALEPVARWFEMHCKDDPQAARAAELTEAQS
ncbi:MAG: phosphotransferase [Pseudomonadota bacterium]|nr:phosphotransferase [Pseudomonadota bacterium]